MPAYQSADLVPETLAAVARQTYGRIRVIVSVDASTDGTVDACRTFESDPRFSVKAQPTRLGWIGNVNYLLDRVATEFFVVMPHDDLIVDDYVEVLRAQALRSPHAVVTYGDIQAFDARDEVERVVGLDGPLIDRVAALLASPRRGVPWRGLTRSWVLGEGLRMSDSAFGGYGEPGLWVLKLLCRAPFARVPRRLYRRRIRNDPRSLVQGWQARELEERFAGWADYSAACLRVVADVDASDEARLRLVLLQIAVALNLGPGASARRRPDDRRRREELVMLATLAARSLGIGELSADALVSLRRDRPLWRRIASLGEE